MDLSVTLANFTPERMNRIKEIPNRVFLNLHGIDSIIEEGYAFAFNRMITDFESAEILLMNISDLAKKEINTRLAKGENFRILER